MNSVVHFEIHVRDPQKAQIFYESVFGWKIEKWKDYDYWLIYTKKEGEPGINGGDALASWARSCTCSVNKRIRVYYAGEQHR